MSGRDYGKLDAPSNPGDDWRVLKIVFTAAGLGFIWWMQYWSMGGPRVRDIINIEKLIGERHFDEAIEALTRKTNETPTVEWPWTMRGEAYRRKGDLDHAFADFDEAIRLKPTSDEAHYNRCLAFRDHAAADARRLRSRLREPRRAARARSGHQLATLPLPSRPDRVVRARSSRRCGRRAGEGRGLGVDRAQHNDGDRPR